MQRKQRDGKLSSLSTAASESKIAQSFSPIDCHEGSICIVYGHGVSLTVTVRCKIQFPGRFRPRPQTVARSLGKIVKCKIAVKPLYCSCLAFVSFHNLIILFTRVYRYTRLLPTHNICGTRRCGRQGHLQTLSTQTHTIFAFACQKKKKSGNVISNCTNIQQEVYKELATH